MKPLSVCLGALAATAMASVASASLATGGVYISELRSDQPGGDVDEYFEICGSAGFDLTGITFVVMGDAGSDKSGVIEEAIDLTGSVIPASGYFLAGETSPLPSFPAAFPDLVTSINFENGDNNTYMLVTGFSSTSGTDLDTDDDGVFDAPAPWTSVLDAFAIENFGFDSTTIWSSWVVGTEFSGFRAAHVYRNPDCGGSFEALVAGSFNPAGGVDTPGAANTTPAISEASPNRQFLRLTDPADPGGLFVILGSFTGTAGIPIDSVVLPLTLDAYTLFMVGNGGLLFSPNVGLLDATGTAYSTYSFPPATSGLIGTSFYHAYAVLDLGAGVFTFASNAIEAIITP